MAERDHPGETPRGDRGVSEVLSFALVFSLVLASVTVVTLGGLDALSTTRDAEQFNNAERAFDVLADNLADVHQRGAPSRATEISLTNAELYTGENVTVNVTAIHSNGTKVTAEREVRPVVYAGPGERTIAYEAGGVFRSDRVGGRVLTDPPFVFRSDRVLLSLVVTRSPARESLGGGTVLVRASAENQSVALRDDGGNYQDIYVNVTTPRRDRWARYFADTPMTEHKTGTTADGQFATYHLGSSPDHLHVVVHSIDVSIDQ